MRAAALQFDVTSDHAHNLEFAERGLEQAGERGIGLVLLPEMWASSFPNTTQGLAERTAQDQRSMEVIRKKSAELGLCVAGSALHREGDLTLNRLQLFDGGAPAFYYDKVHLFTPTAEHEVFSAGELSPHVAETSVGRISGGICYDLRFPELFRGPFRDGVQILLLPAQWPVPRTDHWRALAIARAIENQCFVLACNRTGEATIGRRQRRLVFPGNSLLVSPHGEVLACGEGQDGLVEAELDLDQARSFRVRVPVVKDQRPDLYQRWLERD